MSAKTKIVVFHLKELIYTGIFILLGVLFLILLIIMLKPPKAASTQNDAETMALYVPGVYTSSLLLNDMAVDVEIIVDKNYIHSLRLVNLDDSVTTMFPLIAPSFENLSEQIISSQSIDSITYDQDARYTTQILLGAIEQALLKAQASLDTNE